MSKAFTLLINDSFNNGLLNIFILYVQTVLLATISDIIIKFNSLLPNVSDFPL